MQRYDITGMSCAACSARVEKAVSGVAGVTACTVSLLTNSMAVEGTADPKAVTAAVAAAGYGASLQGQSAVPAPADDESAALKRRLLISLIFLILLLPLSMGHMLGLPLPAALEQSPLVNALIQLLLTVAVMAVNRAFFVRGFKGLIHRATNMDTLVALGAAAAFVYSTAVLFLMAADPAHAAHRLHELYFESAAMILTLITVGKWLEARAKGHTTDALRGLMRLAPQTAVLRRADGEVTVPVEEVAPGDVFVVRPGENVPVDGVVIEGGGAVDESALTGESIPVDKAVGDTVSAATANRSGFLCCRATRVGEDTTLAQIIRMVSDAAATKAPIAKLADRISGIFVPVVLGVGLLTALLWLLFGQTAGFALARGISVLVISCPCALGLATPVAIMVGSGTGARHGLLFKTAASLEAAGRLQTVVLDKTGTVTTGEPVVTDLLPADGTSEEELLSLALSLEKKSEHPLAGAVIREAEARGLTAADTADFEVLPGHGLTARLGDTVLAGGSAAFIRGRISLPDTAEETAAALSAAGKTPLFFAAGDRFLGTVAVADTLRPGSAAAVSDLRQMGLRVVMLTGDNRRTAEAIGRQAGVDEVIADVLPDEKAAAVQRLRQSGHVAMVGDGINDAPALTCADVGIAVGAGTDVAMDAADVVLMRSEPGDIPAAIRLGRATLRIIRQNLFWAFIYNVIGIPVAAGAFIPLFGWQLDPMFAAAAMSLSSFCVVTNALRLNRCRLTAPLPKTVDGTVTLPVRGMMCGHCEAAVGGALEALPPVSEAVASHTAGTVTVTLSQPAPLKDLRKAIRRAGYELA